MVLCHPLQKLFTVDQVMMYYCRSHGSRKLCFLAVDVEVLLPITSAAYSSQVQQQYSVCVCVCVCVCVKPLDMQASSIYCLSQARKNWEDCGRKGIRCKNGGRMEVRAPIVWMGWHLYCLRWIVCDDCFWQRGGGGVVEQKSGDRWCLSIYVFCSSLMVGA